MEDIFGIRQGAAKELEIDPWGKDNSQPKVKRVKG